MDLLLASFASFGLSMLAMAVGSLFGRARIRGSCGGLAGLCDRSGRPLCSSCPHRRAPE
jgi:hypothetical protein